MKISVYNSLNKTDKSKPDSIDIIALQKIMQGIIRKIADTILFLKRSIIAAHIVGKMT